jgi:hypothetical protein
MGGSPKLPKKKKKKKKKKMAKTRDAFVFPWFNIVILG